MATKFTNVEKKKRNARIVEYIEGVPGRGERPHSYAETARHFHLSSKGTVYRIYQRAVSHKKPLRVRKVKR